MIRESRGGSRSRARRKSTRPAGSRRSLPRRSTCPGSGRWSVARDAATSSRWRWRGASTELAHGAARASTPAPSVSTSTRALRSNVSSLSRLASLPKTPETSARSTSRVPRSSGKRSPLRPPAPAKPSTICSNNRVKVREGVDPRRESRGSGLSEGSSGFSRATHVRFSPPFR
jgi:hypothetical protein